MLPLKPLRKNSFLVLPNSWWLLASFDIPWFTAALLYFLPLFSYILLICLHVQISLFLKDASPYRIGHILIQYHLNLIPSAKALFPDKVTLTGSGELELIYLGDIVQPTPSLCFHCI